MNKRKVFIGCSTPAQQIGIADRIKELFVHTPNFSHFDVTIWNYSSWKNFETVLNSLIRKTEESDYAIFIGYPDDLIIDEKGVSYYTTRDNVIFELGLFMAKLGHERTFFFRPTFDEGTPTYRTLSNIGNSHLVHTYHLALNINEFQFAGFKSSSDFLEQIQELEKKVRGTNYTEESLGNSVKLLKLEIRALNESQDSIILWKFRNSIAQIIHQKKVLTGLELSDIVCDVLDAVKDVRDFCKPRQIAELQTYEKGVRKVWVFADSPLEFNPRNPNNPDLEYLRNAVKKNLKEGVEYVYFVSGSTFKEDSIYDNFSKDEKLLKKIQIIFIESKFFKTYFTLHFSKGEEAPTSIYMSSLLRHRDDLLIQISDGDHKERIFERMKKLKGSRDNSKGYEKIEYTIKD